MTASFLRAFAPTEIDSMIDTTSNAYDEPTNRTFPIREGDIVQLTPAVKNGAFICCLMVVTEPKSWGAQGYVQSLGSAGEGGGQAYYRATWEEMEPTGGRAPYGVA